MQRVLVLGWLLVCLLGFSVHAHAQYGRVPVPEFDTLQRENDARFQLLGPAQQAEYRRRALQMGNHLILWGSSSSNGMTTIDVESTFGVVDGNGNSLRLLAFAERAVGADEAQEIRDIRRRRRIVNWSMAAVGAVVAATAVPFLGSNDAEEFWDEQPERGSPEYDAWRAEFDELEARDSRRELTGLLLLGGGFGLTSVGVMLESLRHPRWSTPAARYDEDEVIRYVLRHNSLLLNELGAPAVPADQPAEPSSEPNVTPDPNSPVALIGRYGALAIRE